MTSAADGTERPAGAITDAEEIAHYDDLTRMEGRHASLRAAVERVRDLGTIWAVPLVSWLDTVPDCAAQADVYVHLSGAVVGGRVLQVGGKGQAVLKALVGGAASGVLVTPSQGEADLASRVAAELDLADRFSAEVAFAEDLPLGDGSVTAVISEGCMHHTGTTEAFREAARVLAPGGRFGAWDPWDARLHSLGTRLFGKRDPHVGCHPLDAERVAGLADAFPVWSDVRLHGAVTRYPGLVWSRLVRPPAIATSYRLTRIDDRLASRIPVLGRNGSSCALLATT